MWCAGRLIAAKGTQMKAGAMPEKQFMSAPLYMQLRTTLARRIAKGDWKPGDTMPNEIELAKEYGLSAGTVRKALDWMEEMKLISRQQGRGTFVTDPASKEFALRFHRLRDAEGRELKLLTRILSISTGPSTPREQAKLGLHPVHSAIRIRKLSSTASQPVIVSEIALPADMFPTLAEADASALDDYHLVEAMRANGVLIGKGMERISTSPAEGDFAEALQVAPGTIVLHLDRIIDSMEGRPAEWRQAWCNLAGNHYLTDLG